MRVTSEPVLTGVNSLMKPKLVLLHTMHYKPSSGHRILYKHEAHD